MQHYEGILHIFVSFLLYESLCKNGGEIAGQKLIFCACTGYIFSQSKMMDNGNEISLLRHLKNIIMKMSNITLHLIYKLLLLSSSFMMYFWFVWFSYGCTCMVKQMESTQPLT